MSKRLSDLTGKLGFVAAVCSHDWISRLWRCVGAVERLEHREVVRRAPRGNLVCLDD